MEDKVVNRDDYLYEFTRYKAVQRFKMKPVRVKHLTEVMKDDTLDFLHSRPGLPYEPQFKTTADLFKSASARYSILEFWSKARRDGQVYPPPAIISYPTDSNNATTNIRPVCEFPAVIALGEAQFALPLLRGYLADNKTPMAYALNIPNEEPWCLRSQLQPAKFYGSNNFEKFEERLRRQLIRDAFFVLFHNFDLGAYDGWEIPNVENMNWQYFHLVSYFLNTLTFCISTAEFKKLCGHFPSGSQFTKLIDIVLYWMLVTYGYLKSFYCFPTNKQIFGER